LEWLHKSNPTKSASSFNYKLLLLERNESSKSFSKMFVFPGGLVEETDKELGDQDQVCAIREMFEEGTFVFKTRLELLQLVCYCANKKLA